VTPEKSTNIDININGTHYNIAAGTSLGQAITLSKANTNIEPSNFVIALNQTFVPRSQYQNTQLQNNDAIELLSPMAGG